MCKRAALLVLFCLASLQTVAQPTVTTSANVNALIGESVTFDVTFANPGPTGFAPYVEFRFDAHGADGIASNGPCDGVQFVSAIVTNRNPQIPLTAIQRAPATPCTTGVPTTFPHPFSGLGTVSLQPGEQHVVLPLPFGSFVTNQNPVSMAVTVVIHPYADDNVTLNISVGGGFRYGLDPLDNWTTDPPLPVSASGQVLITPHVFIVDKLLNASEGETVSGPNYGYSFTVSIDVAPLQTVNNVTIHDCASTGVHLGLVSATPTSTVVTVTPPQCFDAVLASLTGPATAPYTAVRINASFWLDIVLPTNSVSCNTQVTNGATVTADWLPLDQRDHAATAPFTIPVSGSDAVSWPNKPIAVQKTTVTTPPGPVPGSIVTYTLAFQVPDYHVAGNIRVTDLLSDGQTFIGGQFQVSDQFGTTAGPLPAGTVTVTRPVTATFQCDGQPVAVTGSSQVDFDISAAMQALGTNSSHQTGVLTGGLVNTGGGPALGQIVFTARVDDAFTTTHSPNDDGFVDKHDPLYERAEISVLVVRKIGSRICGDDTRACLIVPGETFKKFVIARNGQLFSPVPTPLPPPALPQYTRGDTATFSISKTLFTGDAEAISVDEWVPQPGVTTTNLPSGTQPLPPCAGRLPLVNQACYESTAVLASPTYQAVANNGVTFLLGNTHNTANTAVTIEIRITLPISWSPMADGLLQMNDTQECELNSYGDRFCKAAVAQLQIAEPNLRMYKAIICADGPCLPLQPDRDPQQELVRKPGGGGGGGSLVLPKPICPAPGCNARFAGTVNSTNIATILATNSVNLDAGDKFSFAAAVENIGSGSFGAFDVKLTDVLPANFPATIVPNSICIHYGDGTPAPHLGIVPIGANGFAVELDDTPSLPNGALAAYSPISGRNIVLVTFDLVMNPPSQVNIGICSTNTAVLDSYSNEDGGKDFVAAGYAAGTTASATVCVRPKALAKFLPRTSEAHTFGTAIVAIGEVTQFTLTWDAPEGTATPFQVVDTLPDGFQYFGNLVVGQSGGLTFSPPVVTTTPPNQVPNLVTFDFGTLTNPNNDRTCETMTITFNALVLNDPVVNPDQAVKVNQFEIFANGLSAGISPAVATKVVRPLVWINKLATPVISSGGPILYSVAFGNSGSTTAFDVRFNDPAPSSIAWSGAVTVTSNPVNCATSLSGSIIGNTVVVSAQKMPPNCSVTASFRGLPLPGDPCPSLVPNTASVVHTSLPGPNGTIVNSTGSATPGASGSIDGESQETAMALANTTCISGGACDLWIGKTHSTPVVPGQPITFTLFVDVPPGSDCGCQAALQDVLPVWLVNPVIGPLPPGWTQTSANPFTATSINPMPLSSVFTITGTLDPAVHSGDTLNNCIRTDCKTTNYICDWFVVP